MVEKFLAWGLQGAIALLKHRRSTAGEGLRFARLTAAIGALETAQHKLKLMVEEAE